LENGSAGETRAGSRRITDYQSPITLSSSPIAENRPRCRFARFKLAADLLNLRRLLFELRGEGLYFFLLLRDRGLKIAL
jgi:hypothetical protein